MLNFDKIIEENNAKKLNILAIAKSTNGVLDYSFGDIDKMYKQKSISKILTSTAIGMLLDRKLCNIDDKVCDYVNFGNNILEPKIREVTIKNCLTQTMGTHKGFLFDKERQTLRTEFLEYIATKPIERPIGSYFEYNNATFYILSRLVEAITARPLEEFLQLNLFDVLGVVTAQYERCNNNHTLGCSGYLMRTIDVLKVGELYLNGGVYKDERLLSKEYVDVATRKFIRVNSRDSYGYGWWVRKGFFYCSGANNQLLLILPHTKEVIAINGDNQEGHVKEFLETIFVNID